MLLPKRKTKMSINLHMQIKGKILQLVCCKDEENFPSPLCIFQGVNKKANWEDKIPRVPYIAISKESPYVNTDFFSDWVKNHFIPPKVQGTCFCCQMDIQIIRPLLYSLIQQLKMTSLFYVCQKSLHSLSLQFFKLNIFGTKHADDE